MNRPLNILTKRFPYFTTEAFLESEIKIITHHFENTTILPQEKSPTQRQIPSNVKIDDSLVGSYHKGIISKLKVLFSFAFWKAIYTHRSNINTLANIKTLFVFISRYKLVSKRLLSVKERLNDSVIYTYWFNDAVYALLRLRETGKIKNAIIVSRAHRYDLYEGRTDSFAFWPYRKYCIEQIDKIFVISKDGKNFIEDRYGDIGNVEISRLGVYNNEIISRASEGEVKIVSAAWISERKRIDLVFNCILQFARKNIGLNITWTHFGDGPLMDKLVDLVNTARDLDNFRVELKGKVSNRDIIEFYKNETVDLFINLSSSEGVPVSIMEAQSFGIPVLATNVGGTSEIVHNSVGHLLPANPSVDEVVEGLTSIVNRKISRTTIKNVWAQYFDADKNYNDFARALKLIALK